MKIYLSPVSMSSRLVASVVGDVLTVNDIQLDFSPLQDGETLPSGAVDTMWITGPVRRIDGVIHLTLVLPHGHNAPRETRFPAAYDEPMTVVDGEVPLPPYSLQEPDQMPETFIAGGVEA